MPNYTKMMSCCATVTPGYSDTGLNLFIQHCPMNAATTVCTSCPDSSTPGLFDTFHGPGTDVVEYTKPTLYVILLYNHITISASYNVTPIFESRQCESSHIEFLRRTY